MTTPPHDSDHWYVPGDGQYPTAQPTTTKTKAFHPVTWILGGIILLLILACGGVVAAIATAGGDDKDTGSKRPAVVVPSVTPDPGVRPTPDPTPAATPEPVATTAPPKPKPKPTIDDGVYHVGEDVPAGTYRLRDAVDGSDFCYWVKSKDAEGGDIIDNNLASTGRLQVTLKKGQWFSTERCGTWVKK